MSDQAPWLLLDLGNSAWKWRLAGPEGLAEAGGRAASDLTALNNAIKTFDGIEQIAIASVASSTKETELRQWLSQQVRCPISMAIPEPTFLGLISAYEQAEAMGVDRWLAMLSACNGSAQGVCVVDAGTALTIDLVSSSGQHEGGMILPGPELMGRALSSETGRIRVQTSPQPSLMPGRSTEQCVTSGAWHAALGAVRSVAEQYPQHTVIVTGGHAGALIDLGLSAEHRPDLVFDGLRIWLAAKLDAQAP